MDGMTINHIVSIDHGSCGDTIHVSAVYWTTDYCNYRATKQIINKSNSLDLPQFKKSIYLFRYTNNSLCIYRYIVLGVAIYGCSGYMWSYVYIYNIYIYITHIYI